MKRKTLLTLALACFALTGIALSSWIVHAASYQQPSGQAGVHRMGQMFIGRWADDASSSVLSITNTSQQYTIPDLGDSYIIAAVGNSVELLCGSNPTVVPGTTRSLIIPEGGYSPRLYFDCVDANSDRQCDTRKCAYASASSAGSVIFMRFKSDN